jgi:CheY-like chemotaxis protein
MDRLRTLPRGESLSERRILVVEDHQNTREMLWRLLPTRGWRVSTAGDGISALQQLDAQRFDAVLADDRLPGPRGVRVLEHARRLDADVKLVLYGGWLDQEARERARAIGAACVTKGALESLELLLTVLEDC